MTRCLLFFLWIASVLLASEATAQLDKSLFALRDLSSAVKKPHPDYPRLAADFEPQRALVLSVSDWQPHHAPVFRQLVANTKGHIEVLVLCNHRKQFLMVMGWLENMEDQCEHLHFAILELDTIWLRDFAPLFAETENQQSQVLDFLYAGERPKDDRMPLVWSERTGVRLVKVPFTLQGGNLCSNGQHLAMATERIFVDNAIIFPHPVPGMDTAYEGRKIVFEAFLENCNLEQFIILEPLQSEATRHVDMFACFVSSTQVVVAALDPRMDPVNAAILDRNAKRLQGVTVDGKPLEVHRVQIPPRNGQSWSAYTNVIFANDRLLIPTFDSDPKPMIENAIQLYQKLLPNHTIKTIDITSFKQLQGELHCLSMNLPAFSPQYPTQTVSFAQAVEAIRSGQVAE